MSFRAEWDNLGPVMAAREGERPAVPDPAIIITLVETGRSCTVILTKQERAVYTNPGRIPQEKLQEWWDANAPEA